MAARKQPELRGIAALFGKTELKEFFLNFLMILMVIEGLIFFTSFVYHLSADDTPFPWRPYFFASFVAPVAVTFVLGMVVICFNTYFFQVREGSIDPTTGAGAIDTGTAPRTQFILHALRNIPFLLGLLILILCSGLIYKIDSILAFIGQAGETAAHYMLVSLASLLGLGTLFGLVWMVLSYRLRLKRLDQEYQYRKDVMDRHGMVILPDNTVVNQQGRVVTSTPPDQLPHEKPKGEEISLIPKLPRR